MIYVKDFSLKIIQIHIYISSGFSITFVYSMFVLLISVEKQINWTESIVFWGILNARRGGGGSYLPEKWVGVPFGLPKRDPLANGPYNLK